jgi:hypothetical protein
MSFFSAIGNNRNDRGGGQILEIDLDDDGLLFVPLRRTGTF